MNLYDKPTGVQTRWASFENPTAGPSMGGRENQGAKGHAFDSVKAGETKTLLDFKGSGVVTRIWLTIDDRGPEMLRGLRLDMFWDDAERPAVSAPLGDFFGIAHGRRTAFECALFSDPEGRSFNCFIPMPFRTAARITLTNELDRDLIHLFYDVDLLTGVQHGPEAHYFHAHWRRRSPNRLGEKFDILPRVNGSGRFLGFNAGIIADAQYEGSWWGEGEVKVWFGDEDHPTLCGTGTEDYIGTGWGQGIYGHRTQGCLVGDREARQWAFYRYHIDDPIYFSDGCKVGIQTIGGAGIQEVLAMRERGVPLIPVSVDTGAEGGFIALFDRGVEAQDLNLESGWCNFWRQDDWCATAYFYLNSAEGVLPAIAPAADRIAGLVIPKEE